MRQRNHNKVSPLSETSLSNSTQNQLLQIQLKVELATRRQFNISKNALVIADLLAFASTQSSASLSRSYELFIDSLKSSEKQYLKQNFGCDWLIILNGEDLLETTVMDGTSDQIYRGVAV